MDGILLIDKPAGVTSRDVVDAVGRKFGIEKAGHTGTLDPFATGLMVITLGKATKAVPFLEALDKVYLATLKLGAKTDTGDLTGTITEEAPIPPLSGGQVIAAMKTFLGTSMQIPPMFSALKVDGVPLYKKARQGEEVPREPRPIHIESMKLRGLTADTITFEVRCSKGTYIRVLGEDLARALGTCGHLTSLQRLSIGKLRLVDAHALEFVTAQALVSVREALDFMEKVVVKGDDIKKIKDGKAMAFSQGQRLLVITDQNEVLAVYEKGADGLFRSVRGLF